MRQALARYVIDVEPRSANYSLRFSDDPNVFHVLYRGSCVATASPDPLRVVQALIRCLDAHAGAPAPLVPVQGIALVRGREAMIVPTLLEDNLRGLARKLSAKGIGQIDTQTVFLDLERREVVIEPVLDIDRAGVDRLVGLAPIARRVDATVEDGRYRLARWLFMEFWDPVGRYTRATATRRAALVVRGGPAAIGDGLLDRLAHLFDSVEAEGIDPHGRSDVIRLLRL